MDSNSELDQIHISDLLLRGIVGIAAHEREKRQDIVVNLTLYGDFRKACQSDSIEDTVDYKMLKLRIIDLVEEGTPFLIEHLAQKIADLALGEGKIQKVRVRVDKPSALRFARSVGVEIVRCRE